MTNDHSRLGISRAYRDQKSHDVVKCNSRSYEVLYLFNVRVFTDCFSQIIKYYLIK